MFDFIKAMFSGTKSQNRERKEAKPNSITENYIEVLKTSDYNEGAQAAAIEQLVAEQEMPPAELNLPAADLTLPSERELPTAQLDLPTYELDEPTQNTISNSSSTDSTSNAETISEIDADNYLLGDLASARKQRANQTRKAALQYWSKGLQKYRSRRNQRKANGTTGESINYFDVLRDEPMLRQVELHHPGMPIEQLNLNKFVHESMKGKMVSEFVLRSLKLIRQQKESGVSPEWFNDTTNGALERDMHQRTLRDMFSAWEAEGVMTTADVDQLLEHFEEIFQHNEKDAEKEDRDSYNRWLLNVAEDASASDDILWLLVEDENPDVRFCLAENYNIDQNILKALSEDENPYVAHRAKRTLMRLQNTAGRVVDREFGAGDGSRNRKTG
ncbi:MAG: hypothetical protein U0103_04110 [Candidatus Obscuribacterales bacterium]